MRTALLCLAPSSASPGGSELLEVQSQVWNLLPFVGHTAEAHAVYGGYGCVRCSDEDTSLTHGYS